MSHIDEGRLHEYLDAVETGQEGQDVERHLAECAECSALLEEVQLIRDRASALLRDAAPVHVSMPPFEEIQARAEARARKAPRRVFAMNRLTAFGWAATIVLAVGVGWLARGSFNFGSSEPEELRQREVATLEVEAPAAMDVTSGAEEADRGAPTETVPAQQEATGRRSAQEPVEEEVTTPPMTDDRMQMAVAPPAEPERTDILAEPSANVAEPEQPAAAKADAMVAGVMAPGMTPVGIGQVIDAAREETSWHTVSQTEAEQHIGGQLLFVRELPVDSILVGEVNGQPAATIVQTFADGDLLEVVQWRQSGIAREEAEWQALAAQEPVAREKEEGTGSGITFVAKQGFLLALRAAVSADSLAVLAGRLR
jgi:hypothetical protein